MWASQNVLSIVSDPRFLIFNAEGLLVVDNQGDYPELPERAEVGYFPGSRDLWDGWPAGLIENSRREDLVTAGR